MHFHFLSLVYLLKSSGEDGSGRIRTVPDFLAITNFGNSSLSCFAMKHLKLVTFVLVCAITSQAQHGGFTLEQVMSSPFPTGLTAAAKANRIAWVFNAKGERNVWVADAPEFAARQVTHYSGDEGQDILSLRLTLEGKTVVYARGSEVSR